jgi:hypothetical protein
MAAGGILTLGLGGFSGAGRLLTLGYSAGADVVVNGPWCVEAVQVRSAGAVVRQVRQGGAVARQVVSGGAESIKMGCCG